MTNKVLLETSDVLLLEDPISDVDGLLLEDLYDAPGGGDIPPANPVYYQHPVGAWVPWQGSGDTVEDLSPWGNDGAAVGGSMTWVDTPTGKAVSFAGSVRADIPNDTKHSSAPVTYVATVRLPSTAATGGADIVLLNVLDSGDDPFTLTDELGGGTSLVVRDDAAGSKTLTSLGSHSDGDTLSLAWSIDASGAIIYYVNGIANDTDTLVSGLNAADGAVQIIPTDPGDDAQFIALYIYNRVLSPAEIQYHANDPYYPTRKNHKVHGRNPRTHP